MKKLTKVLLIIMDGFGCRAAAENNAILHAHTPHLDNFIAHYAFATLDASEEWVGLPKGQFGNSEVGHLNIGAGRIVQQDISRIDRDIASGAFAANPVIRSTVTPAQNHTLHIVGLLSDGGVHSHEHHIHTLIRNAHAQGVHAIRVHAFLDGRDTPPKSAECYLARLEKVLEECPGARLASVSGRYWAMDRDARWERLEPVTRLLVDGEAPFSAPSGHAALSAAYQRGETDEFVQPTRIEEKCTMNDGDTLMFMNFRADRIRQLASALTQPTFSHFSIRQPAFRYVASLTSYGEEYKLAVAYKKQVIHNGLGEYLSKHGLTQLRIAETEKYPHVTYFFNGGEEHRYPGEARILVPSPKVPTYDVQPQMSAVDITDHIVEAIQHNSYDAIVCNYANCDMVGHTGNFSAAVQAVEILDTCLGRCVNTMLAAGGEVLITADHGNCEMMYDETHHQPHTQHTLNKVPLLYIGRKATIRGGGALKDVAPSLLAMMGIDKPSDMTGNSLIHFQ